MSRVIIHIDMNAYFASVAKASRSDLENQPVAVSHSTQLNSIITTACYVAREYGIKSGMTLKEAYTLCPQLTVVETQFDLYKQYTKKIFSIIRRFSIFIEPASIDECYVDVSEVIKTYARPLDLAITIQKAIFEETGIGCSIGIASNKFLAKMASDMRKPNGITVLRKSDLALKMWPLPIDNLYGIGKKTAKKLKENQINTIYDFISDKNYEKIRSLLGKNIDILMLNAKGIDNTPLSYNQSIQSISQSKTYTTALSNDESIISELKLMIKTICSKANEKEMFGKHISLVMRDELAKTIIRSVTINHHTNDYNIVLEHVLMLFEKHYNGKNIKLLGAGLGSLIAKTSLIEQISLFEQPKQLDMKQYLNDLIPNANFIYLNELKEKKDE